MSTRNISTRLILEGEKEYKAAVGNINRELKTLKSELELVDSKYKGQVNSLQALEAKNKALNDIIAKQSEILRTENKALEDARTNKTKYADAAANARKRLDELKTSTDDATKETDEYKKKLFEIQAEINKYDAAEQKAASAIESHTTAANKAQVKINDLNRELADNEKYLDEARNSADGCAKSIDEYGKQTKEAAEESEDLGGKSTEAINALAAALVAAGAAATVKEIAEALKACADASIEFESAFAGVKKTVNATDSELMALSDGIKDMALQIPATTTEIASVAEAAGQLGIATDDILPFTEVMTNLGVATNLSADAAASALAKFANVVKMSPDSYDRLGSTIVALGNNFATTEADIVSMATRLASTGSVVGLSESQIMAVATAVSSLGIESEAGGSAVSKLLKQIETAAKTYDTANDYIRQTGMSLRDLEMYADADGKAFKGLAHELGLTGAELKGYMSSAKDMENFSRVAGMSAKDFQRAWGDDAVRALDMFIGGLGRMDASGQSAVAVLQDMGLTEVRLSNAVLSMASNGGILTKALDLSNQAWEENNALTNEAEQRYETTESKIALFKNSVENLKVAVGDRLTPALGELAEQGTGINEWVTDFITENEAVVPVVMAVVTAIGVMVAGLTVFAVTTIPQVVAAFAAFRAALAANPYFLVATAIAAVVAAIATLVATAKDATTAYETLTDSIVKNREEYEKAVKAIDDEETNAQALLKTLSDLMEIEDKSEYKKQQILEVVKQLNEAVPGLALAYDKEADSLNVTTEELARLIDAEFERLQLQEAIQRGVDLRKEEYDIMMQLGAAQDELAASEADLASITDTNTAAGIGWDAALTAATAKVVDAKEKVAALTVTQEENRAELAALTTETETAEAAQESWAGTVETRTAEAAASLSESVDAIKKKYMEQYEEAYSSIKDTIGLFSEMKTETKTSVDDMISALDSQIKWQREYSDNLNSLLNRDIDGIDNLAANFMDGTEESANHLATLKNASDEEVEEIIAKLKASDEGTVALGTNFADAQTKASEAMEKMAKEVETKINALNRENDAFNAGAANVQGLIDGMQSELDDLNAMHDRIARSLSWDYDPGKKQSFYGATPRSSNAAGLDYVPGDNYLANLHKGEMVLTAMEAKMYRAQTNNIRHGDTAIHVNIGNVTNYDTATDMDKLARTISEKIAAQTGRKGTVFA